MGKVGIFSTDGRRGRWELPPRRLGSGKKRQLDGEGGWGEENTGAGGESGSEDDRE